MIVLQDSAKVHTISYFLDRAGNTESFSLAHIERSIEQTEIFLIIKQNNKERDN